MTRYDACSTIKARYAFYHYKLYFQNEAG